MKTALLTLCALLAFAGNSILCRLALGDNTIDAASFTWIRLLSGIVVLLVILKMVNTGVTTASKGSWKSSFILFLYAVCFSFAYLSLETGMGALILFSSVQATIILTGLLKGEKLNFIEWLGSVLAFLGFIYLVMPGLSAPPLGGFILMSLAGAAWGFYTLAGRGSPNPLSDTTYNFIRTFPFLGILLVFKIQDSRLSVEGIILAVISGGIASGIGYTIWYMALNGLSTIQASVVQLLVPVIAALGGVLFAAEHLSLRLVLSSVLILGGVLTVIIGKRVSLFRDSRKTQ